MHRVYVDFAVAGLSPGESVAIVGDEAGHALRVKRVRDGERITLIDGRGGIAEGVVARDVSAARSNSGSPRGKAGGRSSPSDTLHIVVDQARTADRPAPWLEILTATPKGGRADEMIDQLSQAGAAAWGALATEHGVVDPRDTKLARLERIARESSKQCGRAWIMEVRGKMPLAEALRFSLPIDSHPSTLPGSVRREIVIADASGAPYTPSGAAAIRVLVGPEGGFTSAELETARSAGARIARFGPHIMRIETAAVVAAGVIMTASQ